MAKNSRLTGTYYLRNANTAGPAETTFRYGPQNSTWLPVVGDWDRPVGESTSNIDISGRWDTETSSPACPGLVESGTWRIGYLESPIDGGTGRYTATYRSFNALEFQGCQFDGYYSCQGGYHQLQFTQLTAQQVATVMNTFAIGCAEASVSSATINSKDQVTLTGLYQGFEYLSVMRRNCAVSEARFEELDADADGFISAVEGDSAGFDIDPFDTNGDGVLSREEYESGGC